MPPRGRRAGGGASASTQQLVSGMMKRSGLTQSQQRRLMSDLQNDRGLATSYHPTSSEVKAPAKQKGPLSRKAHVRKWAASTSVGRKSERDIKADPRYQRPQFSEVAKPIGVSRDLQREFASDCAAFGPELARKKQELRRMAAKGRLPRAGTKANASSPVPALPRPQFSQDDMDFMREEIREREAYLHQLEKLGKGKAEKKKQAVAELNHKKRMLEVMGGESRGAENWVPA